MSTECTVRRGKSTDLGVIASFQRAMARETESKELESDAVRAGVEAMLRNRQRGFYLLAESGDKVVGSLMVTPEWSDWRNGFFWWIQSVYVRPEHRRTGVYRALYEHAKFLAQDAVGICGLRLYVERENEAARDAYTALGMDETAYRLYEDLF